MTMMIFDCPDEMTAGDVRREKRLFEEWAREAQANGQHLAAAHFHYVADNCFKDLIRKNSHLELP